MWQRDIEQIKRLRESAWRLYNRLLERFVKAAVASDERSAKRYAHAAHRAKARYDRRSAAYVQSMNSQPHRVLFVRSEVKR